MFAVLGRETFEKWEIMAHQDRLHKTAARVGEWASVI
jgi:hypothetical protein